MYPINNLIGIEQIEKGIEEKHVIIFLLLKPSDTDADDYIKNFNYWHYLSKKYCAIYLLGYSKMKSSDYPDFQTISGTDNEDFYYSDRCFIEVCDQLERRLTNWTYSGEPELIILQNSQSSNGILDFSNYNYIDINYGLQKGYIDSFSRFMKRLIDSCKSEVTATDAVRKSRLKRISPRSVLEKAIEDTPKLPLPIKNILNDKLFYKTCKTKSGGRVLCHY